MTDTSAIALRAGKPTITVRQNQIEWAPLADGGRLAFTNTSYKAVKDALFMTFGKFPIRLSKDHVRELRAMAAAAREPGSADHPYTQLIEALNKYGDLELRDL